MAKFKVGDIVKPNDNMSTHPLGGLVLAIMLEGEVTHIDEKDKTMSVLMKKTAKGFLFHEGLEFTNLKMDRFDLVLPKRELHVTTDGMATHAVLKEGGKIVKRAKAVCSPDDEYRFETGARLAVDRVFGKDEKSAEEKSAAHEPKFKFEIGKMVEVVSPSTHCYPAAIDFIKQFGEDYLARFAYRSRPTKGILYTVRQRAEWKMGNGEKKKLYVIEEFNIFVGFYGAYYIVDEEGLVKAS